MAFSRTWRGGLQLRIIGIVLLLALLQSCSTQNDTDAAAEKSAQENPLAIQAHVSGKSATNLTAAEASRFLQQATFGPKESEITALTGGSIDAWLTAQLNMPVASPSHYSHLQWLATQSDVSDNDLRFNNTAAVESFFKQALTGQDQLRQRTTWAYSQIFVIGDMGSTRNAAYYDVLNDNAFGNYRTLLEKVTLSPAMGQWLSHIANEKEDLATGRLPDENYAREVMQLFSIGLWQLNQDGTRKLDANNQPIPTYTQADIGGMAKVFTGWSYANCNPVTDKWYCIKGARGGSYDDPNDVILQMTPMVGYHSTSVKNIVGGVTIPAGGTAEQDLKIALDTLFNHPNVGPFIGKQLIQRFVKSNPSPAYVSRVAAAFNNNGSNVRGDMKAVIRAVLIDPEARDATSTSAGKLREPVLRFTHFMRAFTTPGTRLNYNTYAMNDSFGQKPMSARSVFNFYSPAYSPPGEMSNNNLLGPEFQIYHEATSVEGHNYIENYVGRDINDENTHHTRNYAAYEALSTNPAALVDRLNLIMTGNTLTPEARNTMITAVTNVGGSGASQAENRVEMALMLFQISPDYLIQK